MDQGVGKWAGFRSQVIGALEFILRRGIEGELTFWVGGKIIKAPEGSFVYGPRDIPHTFTVTSSQARSIVVTEPAGFEKFMRALGEPAAARTIPPASVPLPGRDKIMAAAADFGLEILGPPGIPS